MARRNPPAKWTLPSVVDPPTTRCFVINVPNEPLHIAAFRGALLNLAAAYKWQDDPTHKAREVALVWRRIVDAVTDCDDPPTPPAYPNTGIYLEDFMSQQIRISPVDPCVIQMWCIDHWEDWYDPRNCIVGGSVQPPPASEIPAGECRSFNLRLPGNMITILPISVSAGDTIQISDASGGWWNGDALEPWACPSGDWYILGGCTIEGTISPLSPIPTKAVGRVVARIDGVYYDAFNTTIGVPSGLSDVAVYFQMNDDDITDNSGSISITVEVCRATEAPITLTYANGSGPESVSYGQQFAATLTLQDDDPINYELGLVGSQCFDVEIVSLGTWTSPVPPASADGLLYPCGGSFSTPWTGPLTTDFSNQQGFNINSTVPTTVVLKLNRP